VGTKSTLVQEDELFGQMVASAKEIEGVKSVDVKTTHLVHWQD